MIPVVSMIQPKETGFKIESRMATPPTAAMSPATK